VAKPQYSCKSGLAHVHSTQYICLLDLYSEESRGFVFCTLDHPAKSKSQQSGQGVLGRGRCLQNMFDSWHHLPELVLLARCPY